MNRWMHASDRRCGCRCWRRRAGSAFVFEQIDSAAGSSSTPRTHLHLPRGMKSQDPVLKAEPGQQRQQELHKGSSDPNRLSPFGQPPSDGRSRPVLRPAPSRRRLPTTTTTPAR